MKDVLLPSIAQDSLDLSSSVPTDNVSPCSSPGTRWMIGMTAILLGFLLVLVGGSNSVRAEGDGSSKPAVTDVTFDPAAPQSGDRLKLRMKLHNAVRAEVKWSVNGDEAGTSDFDGFADGVDFSGTLKTGDKITARVTPFNEMAEPGPAVEKEVTCTKAPPNLKLVSQKLEGSVYKAKIDVIDQEKESVTLSVEGPKGMQIDKEGNITWEMGKTKSGKWPVKVVAKDPKGAEAVLTWTVGISQQK